MLFSVVYELCFTKDCFFEHLWYKAGDVDFFSLILSADSFSSAVDKALDFAVEHYPEADVSIKSIIRL